MSFNPLDPRDELMHKYRAKEISFTRLQDELQKIDEQEDDHRRWRNNYG